MEWGGMGLTPWLTGAGSRRLEGTNIGHENAEGMASRVRHQNADFAFLVKPLPCESTTYAHFCGSFVVATA